MFLEGKDVSVSISTRYGKSLLHQAAPVIDRLSSLEETGHYIYCAARQNSQVHCLNVLGPRGLSAFNFRSLCEWCYDAMKLKLVVSCSDSFD